MEKRKRVLIIEDVATTLESYIMNLEEEFSVHGACNLHEAKSAIEKCTYHVALVDIMLAGSDETNRDGVLILEYLRDLDEGTKAIVVTSLNEGKSVRDYLINLKATDYINKEQLIDEGMSIVKSKINEVIGNNPLKEPIKWETLIKHLAFGIREEIFVSQCLDKLKTKGGFENLSTTLISVCNYLMPLLIPKNIEKSLEIDSKLSVIRGKFWAKGQGKAVEIILCNESLNSEEIVTDSKNKLLESIKKGLKIIIYNLPDARREDFTYITSK